MITNGGLGTIKECILSGVPMIVFPGDFEQPGNAARVVYHGIGLMGDYQRASAEQIRSMIDRINNNAAFKSKIETMKDKFIEMENAELSIKIIEERLNLLP
jgi:UDP:flavonoid glycosyltransferase YjiC (YdhE family)